MSLNWNLADVDAAHKDFIKSNKKGGWSTTGYIILTLGVMGAGAITAKNWSEVYARYRFYWLLQEETPVFTAAELKMRVGLSTNWMFKDESRAAFVGRIVSHYIDTIKKEAERAAS